MDQKLDSVDYRILHALGINGRVSFRRLAEVLETSEFTVARRYRRLVETNTVRVVAVRRPFDHDQGELLRLQTTPGSADKIATALAKRDDVSWIRLAGSGAEIVCGVRAASDQQRDQLVLDLLPKTGRISRVTAHHVMHHFRSPRHADWEGFPDPLTGVERDAVLADAPQVDGSEEARLLPSDRAIIDMLAMDARQTAARVATVLKRPPSTVRRRIDQLFAQGAVHLDRDLDPARLGFAVQATLYLDVDPQQLHAAGTAIATHEPTTFVAATSGPTNLVATVAIRTINDLYQYVSHTLANTAGTRRIETSIANRYLKHTKTTWQAGIGVLNVPTRNS